MHEADKTKTPDFGIPITRGIDDKWRSASDYPIDIPPEPTPAAETEKTGE